ncbi:protein IQ-DOMAIN 11-like [Rutidosis leptorrhynchoides]|uniref:protein IQ-DOMAIN 11-like n=1 Tax=Rutidosis leptorrhynchoides TaxID=125765 RepID=UPI003A9A40EC
MAKRRWLNLIKKLFITETCQNKDKKWRWVFGRHKTKRLTSQSVIIEIPRSAEKKMKQESVNVDQEVDEHNIQTAFRDNNAATKIQTAFRGLLARKALRALKGLVTLQAIIRGHLVRRQAVTILKCLQSVVNIQSQASAKRVQVANFSSRNNFQEKRGTDIKIDMKSQKRWDDSILTKEDENAMMCSKWVAAMKRERIKEYANNHRLSAESEQGKINGKWRYLLEQWIDNQLAKIDDGEEFESQKVKLQNLKGKDSSTYLSKTAHHTKQRSIGEEHSISVTGSPVGPTYMAATQSARAKSRSLSSPRLRPITAESWSATNSPYKHKLLSPISSINSDASNSRMWNFNSRGGFSERSPNLKGVPRHVK